MNWISIFIILKTDNYHLWAFLKSDFRISPAGKHMWELSEIITFQPKKEQYRRHYLLEKGCQGTVVNRALPYLQGHLK